MVCTSLTVHPCYGQRGGTARGAGSLGRGDLKPGREEEGEVIFFWKMIEEIRVRIIAREIRQALAWKN